MWNGKTVWKIMFLQQQKPKSQRLQSAVPRGIKGQFLNVIQKRWYSLILTQKILKRIAVKKGDKSHIQTWQSPRFEVKLHVGLYVKRDPEGITVTLDQYYEDEQRWSVLILTSHNSRRHANMEINYGTVDMESLAQWYGVQYDSIRRPQFIKRNRGSYREMVQLDTNNILQKQQDTNYNSTVRKPYSGMVSWLFP